MESTGIEKGQARNPLRQKEDLTRNSYNSCRVLARESGATKEAKKNVKIGLLLDFPIPLFQRSPDKSRLLHEAAFSLLLLAIPRWAVFVLRGLSEPPLPRRGKGCELMTLNRNPWAESLFQRHRTPIFLSAHYGSPGRPVAGHDSYHDSKLSPFFLQKETTGSVIHPMNHLHSGNPSFRFQKRGLCQTDWFPAGAESSDLENLKEGFPECKVIIG